MDASISPGVGIINAWQGLIELILRTAVIVSGLVLAGLPTF